MAAAQEKRELRFENNELAGVLYGDLNKNLQILENGTGVKINTRGTALTISGPVHDVVLTENLLTQLYGLIETGYPVFSTDIAFGLKILQGNAKARLEQIFLDKVYVTTRNRVISPKTPNQKIYIDSIRDNDVVFGIGPAGTGKTYLAVAMAVSALASGAVRSIILTRPAVEAGEKLGFLPGDLAQKVDPYLRPLNDALIDMLGPEKAFDLIDQGTIEIAPLREGNQVDLPANQKSGWVQARELLQDIKGIGFCSFSKADVVRHPLVQKIIHAYETEQDGHNS